MREYKHVERSWYVGSPHLVKFEAANPNLESIHAGTVVAKFLIAIFDLIKRVDLVFITDWKAGELCIEGDKICSFDRANHKVETLTEILVDDIHFKY